jgi:hypothetical protein
MAFSVTAIGAGPNTIGPAQLQANAVTTPSVLDGAITEPKLEPAVDNARNAYRIAKFIYDQAVDAPGPGSVPFRGGALPANAIITGGRAYVKSALTGIAGTTAGIQAVAADDIVPDAAVVGAPWSVSATEIAITPVGSLATDVQWGAGGIPTLEITTHPLTGGVVDLWLEYIVTD